MRLSIYPPANRISASSTNFSLGQGFLKVLLLLLPPPLLVDGTIREKHLFPPNRQILRPQLQLALSLSPTATAPRIRCLICEASFSACQPARKRLSTLPALPLPSLTLSSRGTTRTSATVARPHRLISLALGINAREPCMLYNTSISPWQ